MKKYFLFSDGSGQKMNKLLNKFDEKIVKFDKLLDNKKFAWLSLLFAMSPLMIALVVYCLIISIGCK
jgi:hypothetical protein